MKKNDHRIPHSDIFRSIVKSGALVLLFLAVSACFPNGKKNKSVSRQDLKEALAENAETNKDILYDLEWYGVNDSADFNVSFFFYTLRKTDATRLAYKLRALNYTIEPLKLENGEWQITGWTQRMNMSLNTINLWTAKMHRLAFECDSYFNYWDVNPEQEPELELEKDLEAWEYFNLAYDFCESGQLKKALVYYSRSIELDDTDASAWYNRGIVKGLLGNEYGAIDDYTQAIELDPEYQEAYLNRGVEYDYTEEYEDAIADYNKALELLPQDALSYFNRGNTWHNLEEEDLACQDWKQALRLGEKDAQKQLTEFCK